jgi:hypothetical protein
LLPECSILARQFRFEIEMKDGEAKLATSIGVSAHGVFDTPFIFVWQVTQSRLLARLTSRCSQPWVSVPHRHQSRFDIKMQLLGIVYNGWGTAGYRRAEEDSGNADLGHYST